MRYEVRTIRHYTVYDRRAGFAVFVSTSKKRAKDEAAYLEERYGDKAECQHDLFIDKEDKDAEPAR